MGTDVWMAGSWLPMLTEERTSGGNRLFPPVLLARWGFLLPADPVKNGLGVTGFLAVCFIFGDFFFFFGGGVFLLLFPLVFVPCSLNF